MKKPYLLALLLCIFSAGSFAQKNTPPVPEALELRELTFDFGKIPQGKPVTHNFVVVNKSKAPLVIENVQASCGCTTPEWSSEPVAPGNTASIKVGFNAHAVGAFQKAITINYNDGQVKTMTISGEVYPSPATSAPANPSLSLLKQ